MLRAFDRPLSTCKSSDLRGLSPREYAPIRSPFPRVVMWAGLCLVVLVGAFLLDAPVDRFLTLGPSSFVRQLAEYVSRAGEGWVVALAGALGSGYLFWRQRFTASGVVFFVAFTGLLTGGAATVIRSLMGRTRPTAHELQGFYGVWHDSHWIIGKYEFGAFPSGHVATVIGLAAAAWLIDRRLGMLAVLYAILVSWSRIALGCHHFSDTVAAAILGIYGAQWIVTRLGPGVQRLGQHLQKAWLTNHAIEQELPAWRGNPKSEVRNPKSEIRSEGRKEIQ